MTITDETPMPWGKKYKDVPIKDIPAGYLLFALSELRVPGSFKVGYRELITYLEEHEEELKLQMKKQIAQ